MREVLMLMREASMLAAFGNATDVDTTDRDAVLKNSLG